MLHKSNCPLSSVRWLAYYRVSTDRQGSSGLGLDALASDGKLRRSGRSLGPAHIGRILQRLGLSGKLMGSDRAEVAA